MMLILTFLASLLSIAGRDSAPLLIAGTPPVIKTLVLQPAEKTTIVHYDRFDGPVCRLDPRGAGASEKFRLQEHAVVAGFDHFYERGSDPFPCVRKQEILYRGNVRFHLSQFDKIALTELKFDAVSSLSNSNGPTIHVNPPHCNATMLGMATRSEPQSGDSHGGSSGGSWEFEDEASLLPCKQSNGFPVNSWVTQWTDGSHRNFGLVLAGPPLNFSSANTEDLSSDNHINVTFYDNFELKIWFNPALNPRVHQ